MSEQIPVKVTDASVRECVMYGNLRLRGEATNQIGTTLTVEISEAYDAWLEAHDAGLRAEVARLEAEIARLERELSGLESDCTDHEASHVRMVEEAEAERDRLAAAVAKALAILREPMNYDGLRMVRYYSDWVIDLLASVPTDTALNEVRAAAWDEGCHATEQYYKRTVVSPEFYDPIPAPVNPYRTRKENQPMSRFADDYDEAAERRELEADEAYDRYVATHGEPDEDADEPWGESALTDGERNR
jgi:hypothetical protein